MPSTDKKEQLLKAKDDVMNGITLLEANYIFLSGIASTMFASVDLVGCGIANGILKSKMLKKDVIDRSVVEEEEGIVETQMQTHFKPRVTKLWEEYKTLLQDSREKALKNLKNTKKLDIKHGILTGNILPRNLSETRLKKHIVMNEEPPYPLLEKIEITKAYIMTTTGFCLARIYEASEMLGFLIGSIYNTIYEHSPEIYQKTILKVLTPEHIAQLYIATSYFVNSFVSECKLALKFISIDLIAFAKEGFSEGMYEGYMQYEKDILGIEERMKAIENDVNKADKTIKIIEGKREFLDELLKRYRESGDKDSLIKEYKQKLSAEQKNIELQRKEIPESNQKLRQELKEKLKALKLKLDVIEEIETRKLWSGNIEKEIKEYKSSLTYELLRVCEVKKQELTLLQELGKNEEIMKDQIIDVTGKMKATLKSMDMVTYWSSKLLPPFTEEYKIAYTQYLKQIKVSNTELSKNSEARFLEKSPFFAFRISSFSMRKLLDSKAQGQLDAETQDQEYSKLGVTYNTGKFLIDSFDQMRAHSYALRAVISANLFIAFQSISKPITYKVLHAVKGESQTQQQERQK